MTIEKLISRVQLYTNDKAGSIYSVSDLTIYLEEALDRVRSEYVFSSIPNYVAETEITILPTQYHYLLALYASSRAFAQDERQYESSNSMNEFEVKFEELVGKIGNGEILIVDALGEPVDLETTPIAGAGYSVDVYYGTIASDAESIEDVI